MAESNFPQTHIVDSNGDIVDSFGGGGGGGGDATAANQLDQITEAQTSNTRIGDLTETAPGSDTASSGLNGRLQRLAQRLTSLIGLFPSSLGQKTGAGSISTVLASDVIPAFKIDQTTPGTTNLVAATQSGTWNLANISGTISLPAGATTDATLQGKGLVSAASIGSVTTAATGTNYTALASGTCTEVTLTNLTGTKLEYRRGGAGTAMPIPDQTAVLIEGLGNSNEIDVRRTDTSNTQVSATFERRTRG